MKKLILGFLLIGSVAHGAAVYPITSNSIVNALGFVPQNAAGVMQSITHTNFVLNQRYTNTSGVLNIISGDAVLTVAAVNGVASLSIMVDQAGGNTMALSERVAEDTTTVVTVPGTMTNNFFTVVSNNATYYLTNTSSGAGNGVTIAAGTGKITVLGGRITGGAFVGNGAGLTSIEGTNIVGGTVGGLRLGSNTLIGVTVSAKGVSAGNAVIPNAGADYGVDTVGTTTSGIQEATNSLEVITSLTSGVGGGVVDLGTGTYILTSSIRVPTNGVYGLYLRGNGSTVIRYDGPTNQPIIRSAGAEVSLLTNAVWFKAEGITFVYTTNCAQKMIAITNCSYLDISHCKFASLRALTNGAGYFTFNVEGDVLDEPPGLVGVYIPNSPGGPAYARVRNCVFNGLADGVYFGAPRGSVDHNFFANVGSFTVGGTDHKYATATKTVTLWTNAPDGLQLGCGWLATGDGEVSFHDNRFFNCGARGFIPAGTDSKVGVVSVYNEYDTLNVGGYRYLLEDNTAYVTVLTMGSLDGTHLDDRFCEPVAGQNLLPTANSAAANITELSLNIREFTGSSLSGDFTVGGGLSTTTFTIPTNATPPLNTSTIRSWINVTDAAGGVGKVPVYK